MLSNIGPGVLLAMVFFGIAIYKLFEIKSIKRQQAAGKDWPQVIGTVTDARVETVGGGKGGSIQAAFSFSYIVRGLDYKGTFLMSSFMDFGDEASKNVKEHPVGSNFAVRYNPEKPEEYITEYDQTNPNAWVQIIGLFLIAVVTVSVSIYYAVKPGR